ncbi:MAG: sensor histidine kinase [Cyclobacteriaceae bacterium]
MNYHKAFFCGLCIIFPLALVAQSDGSISEGLAQWNITPFWRIWWFYLAVVAIIFALGWLYYRTKVKEQINLLLHTEKIRQEEMEKARKRVASDFHDQVGNQLASITVLVQLIKAKLSESDRETQELLTKLGQFSKSLFTGTKDFVWTIDPNNDYFDEMLVYIRDFGEELFEFSDINFHVNSSDSFNHKIALPLGWSRHVIYILKEGLINSLKHSKCHNVYLNFSVNTDSFVLELKDDGLGLNGQENAQHHGIGLHNMKNRAKKINGEITIGSNNGSGTLIVLKGKIP